MERQNDWYTGINYYDNYREKEIAIETKIINNPISQSLHERVEMLYVVSGKALIQVNGCDYPARCGSFFCMYSHHFYQIHSIEEEMNVIIVKFYIGLFLYMCWEKHPKNANAKLMYDTCPMVLLKESRKKKAERLFRELLEEKAEKRFGSKNLVEYKTLELYTYFCRYAFEQIGSGGKVENEVWNTIKKVVLTTGGNLNLRDQAAEMNCSARTLNQRIKAASGYTFFQLQQSGKMLNACALLHFPGLTMDYISGLLGFSSITAFYRIFEQFCKMTPREYQNNCIGNEEMILNGTGLAMQFLQYIHLNFMQDLTAEGLSDIFCIRPYTVRQTCRKVFGMEIKSLINEIRICYAASFLKTGKYSVLEVSSMCGFNSNSTFQRDFKRYMNQTPSQYCQTM